MDEVGFRFRYFITCPFCGAVVPLPDDEPEDPVCVTSCVECDVSFDYDPDDVQATNPPETENPPRRIE